MRIHAVVLSALVVSLSACAATTDEADNGGDVDVESVADELKASAIAGEYQLGQGMFTNLSLRRERQAGHLRNFFDADQVVQCVRAPCPTVHLSGKWYAARNFLQLSPEGQPRIVFKAKLAGKSLTLSNSQGIELAKLTKVEPRTGGIDALLAAKGIPRISVDLPADEAARQGAAHPSAVAFEAALDKALESFLTDADDPESPLGLVSDLDADDACKKATDAESLRCFLDTPSAELGMLKMGESAEYGEKVQDAWIFTLSIPHQSDHGHWAIVDRAGNAATYNYGFN